MISYLDCHAARGLLDAFVDGELPMTEQVALESHLRWCQVCARRVEDKQTIGASLRLTSCAMRSALGDDPLLSLPSDVLTKIRAERDQSLGSRVRDLFADMRLLWPALGASVALFACLSVASTVMSVTSDERPDSLAGMIDMLANPGSDQNPLRLNEWMAARPRALAGAALDSVPGDEAVFALSAVVTREGRVENYEVLLSERASVRRHDAAVETGDVSSVLNAVKQSRFAPAQSVSGTPVAVNVVWVLARTTVKAPIQVARARLQVRSAPLVTVVAPAPPVDEPITPVEPVPALQEVPELPDLAETPSTTV